MKEIKDTCYKGTRILVGNEKRILINEMCELLIKQGFQEISIPIIQPAEVFANKVGEENNNMMYTLTDRGNRNLCLAPEYTAVVQKLATAEYKFQKDVKLFYIQECFRGEKPQAGRYRQFTQFGVEILNPSQDYSNYIVELAEELLCRWTGKGTNCPFETSREVTRGLDYYIGGKGFEMFIPEYGEEKRRLQLCGGGSYDGGVGFAIGIDRLMICK
jgi:histidyl-tRNA synthetase